MLSKEQILKRRDEIIALAKRHGASELRIFGSVARDFFLEQFPSVKREQVISVLEAAGRRTIGEAVAGR